jgi:hypothetical protein
MGRLAEPGGILKVTEARSAAEIAERLDREFGPDALSFVGARVEEARQASDQEAVRLWNDVGRRLALLAPRARGAKEADGPSALWGFMQRIEYCRHRATQLERKAVTAPDAYRQDMVDLAIQWRDLALHADLLAWLSKSLTADSDPPIRPEQT